MTTNLITSVLYLGTKLLPSIRAAAQPLSSSSSNSNISEIGRARAVEGDLESLMRTLEQIKATLYDAEERKIRDRSVKLWLKELKKVAFDAEDVLSEYQYEETRVHVEARKPCQTSGSQKRKQTECIVSIPDDMVDRLKKIRGRFDEIAKDREAIQLRESDGERRPNNKILRPPTGHMVDEVSIFGRDAEIEEVINFLLSEKEKSFSVISIVGKGGLGKTTIAQLVYKDGRVSRCFNLFGWVCVSEEFEIRRLIKATIESISSDINIGASELSPLQEVLAKTVKGKAILLVLDDVWNENQFLWELFMVPFKEAKMVRIIMTTRNKKVAEVMQTTICFRPPNLPEHSCWQLFHHYAFSSTRDTMLTHLVDMGREIMRKCGGLPLAVKSIASLLRHETNEEVWREILESDLWEREELKESIFPALEISYAHLPAHLKPCFLFCSMYPKDYKLEKMNLIELWISHGYIESKGKKRITEIGVEYYEELKERSFLDDFSCGSLEFCKLHDIIHDLGRLNSENEYYSVEVNQPLDIKEGNIPQETYHLYARGFTRYVKQILQQNLKGVRTISLDLENCSRFLEDEYCINYTEAMDLNLIHRLEHLRDIAICNLTKFEALRVLELKGNFLEIPDFIPGLKHLVYLGITSLDVEMLPSSIGLLYNLRTLILRCPSLKYLPESIGDLVQLQFLYILSQYIKKLPKSLYSLSNLLRLIIKCYDLEEIPSDVMNLCNLHGLTIRSYRIQALPKTMGCLSRLEELNLLRYDINNVLGKEEDYIDILDYVPKGLVNFPALKSIKAWLRVRSVAWLKDMKDLKGRLLFKGLKNMTNLIDAHGAMLRNKSKLETLDLCWDFEYYSFRPISKSELILSLIPEACGGELVGTNDVHFSLLECLQPHPNLKKLRVRCYPSSTLPRWMKDPSSLESIQKLSLEYCENIQSLPYGNLHTLKQLTIKTCSSIRVVQVEQLSSQLEELHILECGHLELITGLGYLHMLDKLAIYSCEALKSLMMDELQLVESTKPFGDSSHEKPHISQQSISSLTRLEIVNCCLLHVLPDGLFSSASSCHVIVHGCGCPDVFLLPPTEMDSIPILFSHCPFW